MVVLLDRKLWVTNLFRDLLQPQELVDGGSNKELNILWGLIKVSFWLPVLGLLEGYSPPL